MKAALFLRKKPSRLLHQILKRTRKSSRKSTETSVGFSQGSSEIPNDISVLSFWLGLMAVI
jgi:hypothetical protein